MKKVKIVAVMLTMSLVCMNTMYSAIPVQAAECEEVTEKDQTINNIDNNKSYTIDDIKNLNGDKDLNIAYNQKGLVKSIDGKYTDLVIKNGEDAINSLYNVKDLFGFKDPSKEFTVKKIDKNNTQTIYRLQRLYEGYMVYDNEVIISVDSNGKASFISSNYSSINNINLSFINNYKAIGIARTYCDFGTKYDTDKIIYTNKQGDVQAAWMIKCTSKSHPTKNKILFLNAETGELISEVPLTIN